MDGALTTPFKLISPLLLASVCKICNCSPRGASVWWFLLERPRLTATGWPGAPSGSPQKVQRIAGKLRRWWTSWLREEEGGGFAQTGSAGST